MKARGKGFWWLGRDGVRCAVLGLVLLLGGLAQASEPRPAATPPTLTSTPTPAPSPALPKGHWEGSYTRSERTPRICLDLLPKQGLMLTFHDAKYRNPVVLVGSYVLADSPGVPELLVTVERVVTKEIGPCRRFWVRMDLPHYEVFGLKLAAHSKLLVRVTLSCDAGTSKVQLCLRDPKREAGSSQDHCQLLSAPGSSQCRPGSVRTLDDILPPERESSSPRHELESL